MGVEDDHRFGFQACLRVAAGLAKQAFDDAAILHVRRQQAERNLGDFGPGHFVAVAERRIGRSEETISLAVKR
jgi:hypothetical protein